MWNKLILTIIFCFAVFIESAFAHISFRNNLVDSADRGDIAAVNNFLLNGGNINSKGDFGASAISRAVFRGNIELVDKLIKHGADVNITDDSKSTPILIACRRGYLDIVDLLLNNKADPNISDYEGFSPLLRAVYLGHIGIVKSLVNDNRVQICKEDNYGNFSASYAIQKNHSNILTSLLEKGACLKDGKYKQTILELSKKSSNKLINDIVDKYFGDNMPKNLDDVTIALDKQDGSVDSNINNEDVVNNGQDSNSNNTITTNFIQADASVSNNYDSSIKMTKFEISEAIRVNSENEPKTVNMIGNSNSPYWLYVGNYSDSDIATQQLNKFRYYPQLSKVSMHVISPLKNSNIVKLKIGPFSSKHSSENICSLFLNEQNNLQCNIIRNINSGGVSTNFGERFKQYQQKRNGQNLNANKYWAFLGTYYNLNEASRYFDMLKSKFPQLLGKNNPKIEKSNIGGRKLLRLKTGPFNSKLSASEVCSSLNKHNINCMVVN